MAKILCIETGTAVCSVALGDENGLIGVKEISDPKAHSTKLPILIDELLKSSGITARQLDAVAVSKGPGSYTGLRIGVSMAKGICYSANIPLLAIGSLQAIAVGLLAQNQNFPANALLSPMIDARRMEVYTAIYDLQAKPQSEVEAKIVSEHSYDDLLKEHPLVFFGNGAAKCKPVITNKNAIFIDHFLPSARFMLPLALNAYRHEEFENTAYFEPFYLKDFVATTPKNKIVPGH